MRDIIITDFKLYYKAIVKICMVSGGRAQGVGEMAQHLRVPATLPEDPGSVLSPRGFQPFVITVPGGPTPCSGLCGHYILMWYRDIHAGKTPITYT